MLNQRFPVLTAFMVLFLLSACSEEDFPTMMTQAFSNEAVNFSSGGLNLEGTIFIPDGRAPFPGIVIVNGSGPLDRDGILVTDPSLLPPIYRHWADFLANAGIAVLRYDKRFITHTNLDPLTITQEQQIDDLMAAANFLKLRSEVDSNRIFIVGHSEGGNLAPPAAQRLNNIHGVVLIAAPAFAVDTLIFEQLRANPDIPAQLIMQVEDAFRLLRNDQFPPGGQILGGGEQYWREWINFSENAIGIATALDKPTLVLQGCRDENFPGTTLDRNKQLWENFSMTDSSANFQSYDNVTHLILNSTTLLMSEGVLADIRDWVYDF